MRQRRDWEREALTYLARYGVRDLKAWKSGCMTTDIPGHRQGVLYQLGMRGLVASHGYGTSGACWTITEAGMAFLEQQGAENVSLSKSPGCAGD